jgi:threonine aldolase
MDKIDFRSDTVTWPTPAMRQAMAEADVGDDVYGEDPTVNELEARAAAKLGKEAALFVASGTMGNLVAILSHAGRGDEAILGEDAHTYMWEAGGMASLGGVVPHPLPTDANGRMALPDVVAAIRPDNPHLPHSRLILTENTYGDKNGYPLPIAYFADLAQVAEEHGLALHMDGARFFNAVTALGCEPAALAAPVDSVTFCLSKGLCAPVGSLLCGSADFIHRARRVRKSLGGGMRQAGVLAAAGLIALEEMAERLDEDHAHARRLAAGLAQIPGVELDLDQIKTNIVFFRLSRDAPLTAPQIAQKLEDEANIWIGANGARDFRAVTHYWIDDAHVDLLLETLRHTLAEK